MSEGRYNIPKKYQVTLRDPAEEKMQEINAYLQHYLVDHGENYGIDEAKNYKTNYD